MKKMAIMIFILLFSIPAIAPVPEVELYILKTEYESNLLTWSNINWYIDYFQIKETKIVKKQISHETANLTSRFCREQNNLCGMRLARFRTTTAIGEGNHMSIYRNWQESLLDYKIWQDYFYKGGDYYRFLSRHGYATDIWYEYKLRRIATK